MPYSFYDPNTRSDFHCYFLDMTTTVKSAVDALCRVQTAFYLTIAAYIEFQFPGNCSRVSRRKEMSTFCFLIPFNFFLSHESLEQLRATA